MVSGALRSKSVAPASEAVRSGGLNTDSPPRSRLPTVTLRARHLAALIEMNTRIGASHVSLLMPYLQQMLLAFVECSSGRN